VENSKGNDLGIKSSVNGNERLKACPVPLDGHMFIANIKLIASNCKQ
jgi:hypothetical protein